MSEHAHGGRLGDLILTMEEKMIEVLVLLEVSWPGHGILQFNGTMILYSARISIAEL